MISHVFQADPDNFYAFFYRGKQALVLRLMLFPCLSGYRKHNHWRGKYSQVIFKLHNWWPEIAAAGEARCRRRRQLASWRRRRPSGADQQPLSLQPPAAWTASREEAATSAPRHLLTPVLSSHLLSCPAPALAGGKTTGIPPPLSEQQPFHKIFNFVRLQMFKIKLVVAKIYEEVTVHYALCSGLLPGMEFVTSGKSSTCVKCFGLGLSFQELMQKDNQFCEIWQNQARVFPK